MFKEDIWLSGKFKPKRVYEFSPQKAILRSFPDGFIYTKTDIDDFSTINYLLENDFKIIETTLLFRQLSIKSNRNKCVNFKIRNALDKDRMRVKEIASEVFNKSRFHMDENISNDLASFIKKEWVDNFFKGRRGTRLLVCLDLEEKVVGFLLLINNVIDLIATDRGMSSKGIASHLIDFANNLEGPLQVGTQVINLASINLYKKNNFSLIKTGFTLHKHK